MAARLATFSTIIATYNRREYVLQAVQSVAEQTYPAHEIIVVVDGSTDGTAEAVREVYPEVIVLEQPNLGESAARNYGLARATGDCVAFLDDDDLWHRDKLKVTAEYLASHPECRAVNNPIWFFSSIPASPGTAFGMDVDFIAQDLAECHAAVRAGDSSTNDFQYLDINGRSFELLLERSRGVMSSSVVERETAIRAGGFCPMQSRGEDWTFFLNVARITEWHTLPQRLGFTRMHARQQSGADPEGGVLLLAGIINAWYTGRPLIQNAKGLSFHPSLTRCGGAYRHHAQVFHWAALRQLRLRLAGLIRAEARLLLPRWRDYAYVLIPPQITWRWERYVLGMHK